MSCANQTMFDAMNAAYGQMAAAEYPDRVTFKKVVSSVSDVGGHVPGTPTARLPINVPAKIKPATGYQKALADKELSGTVYMIRVPVSFGNVLVDVDSRCYLEIAPRGGQGARTLNINWIGRARAYIQILASTEE